MPTVPYGRYEGAEIHRLNFSRELDRIETVNGEELELLSISIGGNDEIGYYFKFRGEPAQVVKVMEMLSEAAKQQLPRGRYADLREGSDSAEES